MSDLQDDAIAPLRCLNCGTLIPDSRRGHGNPPKTCSEKCRKERASSREKARYRKVKDTDDWKATRAEHIRRLKQRLATDPEYAEIFRVYAAERTRAWRLKVKAEQPERYHEMLAQKRQERGKWRELLLEEPEAYEAHKAACRAWYHSLNEAERERFFYEPRRKRLADRDDSEAMRAAWAGSRD